MQTTIGSVLTLGDIARELGEPEHRVKHIINSRRIEPVRRIGIIRLFPATAVGAVRQELDTINKKFGRGKVASS